MEYKSKVKDGTKVIIKSLGIQLVGGQFTPQKELKRVHDAGLTNFVQKITKKKKNE